MHGRPWLVLMLVVFAGPGLAQDLRVIPAEPIEGDLLIHSGSFRAGRSFVPSGFCPEGGVRPQIETVFFDPPYREPPQVLVALNSFDFAIHQETPRNPRINARAENVSRLGMKIVVETWCDTNLVRAEGTYLVLGPQAMLAEIAPVARPPSVRGRVGPPPPPRPRADGLDDW